MIVVDTSAWVELFRGRSHPVVATLERLIERRAVRSVSGVPGLVLRRAGGWVGLVGGQAGVVDRGHGTIEGHGGCLDVSCECLRVRQPERAQQERALLAGQAVAGQVRS